MERLRHPVVFNFLCLFDTLNTSSSLHCTSKLWSVSILLEMLTTEQDSGNLTKFVHRNEITPSSILPRHWISLCCLSNELREPSIPIILAIPPLIVWLCLSTPRILRMDLSLCSLLLEVGLSIWLCWNLDFSWVLVSPENDPTYVSNAMPFFPFCISSPKHLGTIQHYKQRLLIKKAKLDKKLDYRNFSTINSLRFYLDAVNLS